MKKNNCFTKSKKPVTSHWKYRCLPLAFAFLLFAFSASAQKLISGNVVDENKTPLEGVSVTLKSNGSGTVTNAQGFYSLTVPKEVKVLVFSMVGYVQKEMAIGSESTLPITLQRDVVGLNDV